ncbi:MAG TPA: hypothetical protein VKR27_00740, partial [Acidimicrobiales bacterium]|nr:hypothetical protein [Acidimicrobiales bacterium]
MTSVTPPEPSNRRGARWLPSAFAAAARPSNPRSALMSALYGACAIAALAVGSLLGNVHGHRIEPRVVLWA